MGYIRNIIYLKLLMRGYEVYIGKYNKLEAGFISNKSENTVYYQVELITRAEEQNKILDRELTPLNEINDNFPKYILTLDDDLDVDSYGMKKINILDWLLDKKD